MGSEAALTGFTTIVVVVVVGSIAGSSNLFLSSSASCPLASFSASSSLAGFSASSSLAGFSASSLTSLRAGDLLLGLSLGWRRLRSRTLSGGGGGHDSLLLSSGISLLFGSKVLLHGVKILLHGGENGMIRSRFIVIIWSIPVSIISICRAADGGNAQEIPGQLEQIPAREIGCIFGPDGVDLAGADGDSALAMGQTRTPALNCQSSTLENARGRIEAGCAIFWSESCHLEPMPLDNNGIIIWAAQRFQGKSGIIEPVMDLVVHRDAVLCSFRFGVELICLGPFLALFFAP